MKDIRVEGLYHTYGIKTILDGVSFAISEGEKIGLIGQNGTGKSTLLSILSGKEIAEAGLIEKSNHFKIGYLEQNPILPESGTIFDYLYASDSQILQIVRQYEDIVHNLSLDPTNEKWMTQFEQIEQKMNQVDGWQVEVKIKTILKKVGIQNIYQPVSELSGGQKKRAGLAKVLMEEPDLLLLDEPTNHLDTQAIQWLEQFLKEYTGSLLLVTHDRYFLERVVDRMFELRNGQIETYTGNYQSYLEQRSQRLEVEQKVSQKQKRLYAQELQWMRQGAKARTTKQQARIQRFEALEESVQKKQTNQSLEISMDQQRIGKRVFQFEQVDLNIANQSILKNFTWIVPTFARVGIIGQNGIGKSTFLSAIAEEKEFIKGTFIVGETVRMAYYKQQDDDIPMEKQVIQYLREFAEEIRRKNGEVASITELLETFLFPKSMHGVKIKTLSGGERRRLYLLRLLLTKPNVLLLDEPTNDLDIDTLTVLEQFIQEFQGCVITVSHDRYFLDKTCDYLMDILGNGQIATYHGAMSDYLLSQQEGSKNLGNDSIRKEVLSTISAEEKKKRMTYHEKKEWETIESTIAELEETVETLQEQMNQAHINVENLLVLQQELEEAEEDLASQYERWEYLANLVEG